MDKHSPYPGDIIDAKLEPGEFVMNRNAVQAIGVENLEEANNAHPRYAQEGGLQEQNELKLRVANNAMDNFKPQYVGNMSKEAWQNTAHGQKAAKQRMGPRYQEYKYKQWIHHHSPMAKERQKAEQIIHDANQMKYGHNPFKGTMQVKPSPPPPPPPLGDAMTPASEQIKGKYLSTIPTASTLASGVNLRGSGDPSKMTPTEKKAHHAARLRAIYENKKQPRPEDMMTPEDLVNKYEPGHPSYQLGQVLKNYRIGDGGMTFDDFKMEKPVAYEYLKKNHSMAFHDMQGDMARFEEKGRRKEEWAEWEKKEMAPHKAAIAERYANLKEKADEDRFFEEEQKRLDWDAKTQKEMSRLANFGLPGWEKGMPRVIVGQMMADWGNNNTVEKQWVDGNYSDEEKEGYTYSDEDVMRDSDAYFKTVFGSLQAEAGARHINPDAIKESAQNLRHLVNVVAEEKGFYSQKNPTGITTEQLSKMNSSIDNNMNFALQGYQTTDEVEKARMAQVEQESKMASKVREEAIKNMEPEQKKEPVSNKLAKFAGSLLFGQKGGYVALQEGGPVSLNNSRRLFNLARRKYA